jgi:hypothetical protein
MKNILQSEVVVYAMLAFGFVAMMTIALICGFAAPAKAASSRDGECRNKSCPANHVKVWVEGTSTITVFNMRDCACLCIPEAQ